MRRTKSAHLLLMLLCIAISIAWGLSLGRKITGGTVDFQNFYYGTRCLMQHCDPYDQHALERIYRADGGLNTLESSRVRTILTLFVNLPPVFVVIAPLALLPFKIANVIWLVCIIGSLFLAAYLMHNLGSGFAPALSLTLVCMVLANCEILIEIGNAAGIVTAFSIIAAWCFSQERFTLAATLCLAIALVIKPHDAGFVWLFFLLAGGVYRKRALQTLSLTMLLALAAFFWISHTAPHWWQEWHTNLAMIAEHGGLNEPGVSSATGREPGMVISLQAFFSVFRDDPHFYNPLSYLASGVLLLIWAMKTLRTRFTQQGAWLALAAASALSLLPVYHRAYDAKLLLLAVPACAMLWAAGGARKWIALAVTFAAIIFTSDIPLAILVTITRNLHFSSTTLAGQLLTVIVLRPTPLILLAMGCFYLWVYVRYNPDQPPAPAQADTASATT